MARTPLFGHGPPLRQAQPHHPRQGLQRRRLLRPQRPHHRGPHRPRRGHQRRCGVRSAMAVLRPGPRVLLLQLLRAVPAPHGLRPLRLLHPQALKQDPALGGQGQPAAHAGLHPPHRRRTRGGRRRPGRAGPAPRAARRRAHPRRPHAPATRHADDRDPPADRRGHRRAQRNWHRRRTSQGRTENNG